MFRLSDDLVFGPPLEQGGWVARLATSNDMDDVYRLRAAAFRVDQGADDSDQFDKRSLHLWVGRQGQGPSATVRLQLHLTAEDIMGGYSAAFYDLSRLSQAGAPVVEIGRLCSASQDAGNGDVLRLLWAGVARVALRSDAIRLIGCTSFPTTNASTLAPALGVLAARNLGPKALRPSPMASETYDLPERTTNPDAAAIGQLPPQLRTYLALGGWVSDHLVIDRDLGTSHIFTCVDIATMPAARKRVLTQLAAG